MFHLNQASVAYKSVANEKKRVPDIRDGSKCIEFPGTEFDILSKKRGRIFF